MTRPTAAPSGFFPEHIPAGMWSPTAPALGFPSVPRAQHRAPVRALSGASPGISTRQQRPLSTRERHEAMREQPPHPPMALRDPQLWRMSSPSPGPCPTRGGFWAGLQRVQLTQPWQLKPGPAKSFTCQCLSHQSTGDTVPAGAVPRELPKLRIAAPPLAAVEEVG